MMDDVMWVHGEDDTIVEDNLKSFVNKASGEIMSQA